MNQPYNLNKGNYTKLRNLLDAVDWSAEMEHLNTNESWDFLLAHLHQGISCSIPKKSILIKKKHVYINREAMKLKCQKELMWKIYYATGNYLDYCRYAHKRNLLRSLTCKLRSEYENSIARNMKSNSKAFWSYVNSNTETKTSLPTLFSQDSTEASSDADKAAVLNQFFCSVFTKESL